MLFPYRERFERGQNDKNGYSEDGFRVYLLFDAVLEESVAGMAALERSLMLFSQKPHSEKNDSPKDEGPGARSKNSYSGVTHEHRQTALKLTLCRMSHPALDHKVEAAMSSDRRTRKRIGIA
ncbi:hypothetical protein IV203_008806 [Nitzschia inconspicua]|uniref:Uncharacterized protein n=1 Tax=Nitzschia inconspicua TaxID=303405 RepID=A0A9K3L0R2_9STRA|nr:hypothetical protein IV203_008806 [Nitzschia inconspicua]